MDSMILARKCIVDDTPGSVLVCRPAPVQATVCRPINIWFAKLLGYVRHVAMICICRRSSCESPFRKWPKRVRREQTQLNWNGHLNRCNLCVKSKHFAINWFGRWRRRPQWWKWPSIDDNAGHRTGAESEATTMTAVDSTGRETRDKSVIKFERRLFWMILHKKGTFTFNLLPLPFHDNSKKKKRVKSSKQQLGNQATCCQCHLLNTSSHHQLCDFDQLDRADNQLRFIVIATSFQWAFHDQG